MRRSSQSTGSLTVLASPGVTRTFSTRLARSVHRSSRIVGGARKEPTPMRALRLEQYFYDRVIFEANPEWQREDGLAFGVKVNVEAGQRTDDPTHWRILLEI